MKVMNLVLAAAMLLCDDGTVKAVIPKHDVVCTKDKDCSGTKKCERLVTFDLELFAAM